ncbi:L7Ae/L30e/S12e/Gadd45 family ribosomal protein [Caldicellulosiruptoraceae bacterium PP1]
MTPELEQIKNMPKMVGARQTAQAIHEGKAKIVVVAKDSDDWVVRDIINMCNQKNIKLIFVDSKKELGRFCGINVSASSAAIL